MGRRRVMVSTEVLVAFMKEHDQRSRTYSVEKPLPNDARVVGARWITDDEMAIELESKEWPGIDDRPIDPPRMTVHYAADPVHPS